MNKHVYSGTDLELYYEKLDNGLDVYVIPQPKLTSSYATFTTKFGSIHNSFRFVGEDSYRKVSDGVAHFLEHKLFESEDGVDPFAFFGNLGAQTNANTSFYRTCYLFDGRDNFDVNLNYLLDFVQTPYLTEENIEKEKGIIVEEAKMYLDKPYWRMIETALYNTFINNPIRIPVIGTIDSINGITKEELQSCYDTFYHPSNMILVVSGAVNSEEVIQIAKNNQMKKQYLPIPPIEIEPFIEPDNVFKEFEEIKMDVEIPKAIINFKINTKNVAIDPDMFDLYLNNYVNLKFNGNSKFTNDLVDRKMIFGKVGFDCLETEQHTVISLNIESDEPETIIELIKTEMQNKKFDEEDFLRRKKVRLASFVTIGENKYAPNYHVFENLVQYNKLFLNGKDMINSMNVDEMQQVINDIDFSVYNVVIIKPLLKD